MLEFFKKKKNLITDYDKTSDQYRRYSPMSNETAIDVIYQVEKYVFGQTSAQDVAKNLGISNAYRVHSLYTKAIKVLVKNGVIKRMICPDCSKDMVPEYTSDGDDKNLA